MRGEGSFKGENEGLSLFQNITFHHCIGLADEIDIYKFQRNLKKPVRYLLLINRNIPYPPNFNIIEAKIIDP